MTDTNTPLTPSDASVKSDIRQQAEKKAALCPEHNICLSLKETRVLIHEQRVHQIELEIQNEELRRVQAELDATRLRYFDLYDLAPVGYVTLSETTIIIAANLAASTLLGVLRNTILGNPISKFILKDDQDTYYQFHKKLFETGEPQACELWMIQNDGSRIWVHLSATLAQNAANEPVCRLVLVDITERKRAVEALRTSKVHLQAIIESTADGILAVDNDGNVIKANSRFAELWRVPESLLKSCDDKALLAFVLEQLSDPKTFLEKVQSLYKSDVSDMDTLIFKDGRIFERYSIPMLTEGIISGRVWSFRDITERKHAQQISQALCIKENQYRELFESGSDALLLIVIGTGKIIDANRMACVLYGYERDELLTKLSTELSAEPEETTRRMQDALNQPGKVFNIPVRLHRKKDGTVFPVEINARAFLQDGETVLLVSCRDITERKRIEAEIKAEKMNSEAMFESSPIALFVIDEKTNIVRGNGRAVDMFGGSAVAALQHRPGNALGCVHSSEDPRGCGYSPNCPLCPVRNGIQGLLANGGEINGVDLPLDLIRDGMPQKVWMEIGAKFVQLEGRRHVCIAMVDITERKRMEEALRKSEERYRQVVEGTADLITVVDEKGRLTFANYIAKNVFGLDKEQCLGLFAIDFVHPDDKERTAKWFRECIDTKTEKVSFENRLVNRETGAVIDMLWTSRFNYGDDGQLKKVDSIARDVTERKRAEVALEKQNTLLTTLLNNLQIGVFMVEVPSGKPLLANQASFNLMGRGILPEAQARTFSKVYDVYKGDTNEPYPNDEMPIVVAMSGVSKYVDDMTVVRPDGTRVCLEVYGSPIKDSQGNTWASLVSFQDITARKEAAEAVIQLAKAKNKFISVVSHELRSPLATIKEATSLVLERVLGPLNDEQKEMLDIAKININRLGRLVNNVLIYQKMDAGKMLYDFLENDVNDIIQEAYRNIILATPERKDDLVINLVAKPPRIKCDKDKIFQVILNLISNGIKYSERGPIVIETRLNTHEIEFSIRDSGQGIYPEELEHVFMPFSHGRGRKTGGTGLGLAISKEIILAHNGKMWVESEPRKGSTFYFTLPL